VSTRVSDGQVFLLPDLGEGLTEAEVVRWLVAVGDVVAVDEPIVEVETAKSIVEVPSPYAGRVAVLHGAAGETVDVGTPLITITATVADSAAAYREEEQAGSGNVLIGYGTPEQGDGRRRRRPRPAATEPVTTTARMVPRVVSPLVRKLAREGGVDLTTLEPSGPDGVIVRADVEGALAPSPAVAPAPSGGEHRRPMGAFRKTVAAALSRSRSEIPEATVWVDVDATLLWEVREAGRTAEAAGPGLLAYLARFVVAALREHPVLNARLDTERDEIVEYDAINLGIAVQGPRGLVVPAVPNAQHLTTARLDDEIRRVTATAREGRTSTEEMAAATFTLNNYGSFRVDGSAAIINHPQVAILGFGRILDRPWVVDGEICVRKITQMSFVFDHRVCDGATAAGFMRKVADAVENPVSAIAML
jgi:pyruvate dehydrogenase E2 component (dihydrolipoamide acetyltransferase)